MTLAVYTGHEAFTFTDYLDLESGKTLHAEPGGIYDIAPTGGRAVLDLPEPWFTALGKQEAADEGAPAEGGGAPGPGGEPPHDEDPETDTSQQF